MTDVSRNAKNHEPGDPAPSGFRMSQHKTAFIFAVLSALVVVFQTSRFWALYDLSFILDHAYRITLGEVPYKDFFLAYPPGTFLIQAFLIKVFGTTLHPQIVYCSLISFLTYLLTYRILFFINDGKLLNTLLALPIAFTGGYGIWSQPNYDPDYMFFILLSLFLVLSSWENGFPPFHTAVAGVSAVIPAVFKQNTGLMYLGLIHLLFIVYMIHARNKASVKQYLWFLAGSLTTAIVIVLCISLVSGIGNYVASTVVMAARTKLPAPEAFLKTYSGFVVLRNAALWLLVVAAFKYLKSQNVWRDFLLFLLVLAPFYLVPLVRKILLHRTYFDHFLSIWSSVVLVCSIAAVYAFVKIPEIPLFIRLMPVVVLGVVNAAFLSLGVRGSTYGLWPALPILLAFIFLVLSKSAFRNNLDLLKKLSYANSVAFSVSMAIFVFTNYQRTDLIIHFDNEGEVHRSSIPSLSGLALPGVYLPNLDSLIKFTNKEIPREDAIVILTPEDPFFFATGRKLVFPLLMYDWTLVRYSSEEILEKVRTVPARWMIIKTKMQSQGAAGDPTIEREDNLIDLMKKQFVLYKVLPGYEIYRNF
jgi:hypothetical protein